MTEKEIIKALWKRDLLDPKVMDYLYSMAVNTEDTELAIKVYKQCQKNIAELKKKPPIALRT